MTSDDEEDTWSSWDEPDWTESHSRILSGIKDELVDELMEIYSSSSKTVDALMKLELPSGVDVELKI